MYAQLMLMENNLTQTLPTLPIRTGRYTQTASSTGRLAEFNTRAPPLKDAAPDQKSF